MVTAINLTAIMFSGLSILISIIAIVLVLAQKWSTHKIEWRPLVQQDLELKVEEESEELEQDDAKVLKEALNLQRTKKKKEQDPLEEILETSNYN